MGRILAAFDARVLVHDPYADPATLDSATAVELPELLRRSTVVSLHARLTPETTGMIGAAELARLPAGAVLVNTARGGLLDYAGRPTRWSPATSARRRSTCSTSEPLPADSRLRTAPRVVLTPHLAGATRQTAERAATQAADAVAAYLAGKDPVGLVSA